MAAKRNKMGWLLKTGFTVVLLSILCLTIMWFYVSIWGLPGSIKSSIYHTLREQGMVIEADAIKCQLPEGLLFTNVVIRDRRNEDWVLMRADALAVRVDYRDLKRGLFTIQSAKLENGTISLPLILAAKNEEQFLTIHAIDMKIAIDAGKIRIIKGTGNCAGIDLHYSGIIEMPEQNQRRPITDLTVVPLLEHLTPQLVTSIYQWRDFFDAQPPDNHNAIVLKLTLSRNPALSAVVFNLNLTSALYRGLMIEDIGLRGEWNHSSLIIDELRINMDAREHLEGNGHIDLTTDEISGQINYYGYPQKLIKAFAADMNVPSLQPWLSAGNAPVKASLYVHPSPLKRVREWDTEIQVSAQDVTVGKARVAWMNAALVYQDDTVAISRCQARIEPDIDIELSGSYLLPEERLMIDARVDGNPLFITQFTEDPHFHKVYEKIWEGFVWQSSDRPHFDISLHNGGKDPGAGLIIQGKSNMKNFSYNGVAVETMAANILVDFPGDLVLVDHLNIISKNAGAFANLVWHGDTRVLNFDLVSDLDLSGLLAFCNPAWHNFLPGLGLAFPSHPHLTGSGHVDFGTQIGYAANIKIRGTTFRYYDARLDLYQAALTLTPDNTAILLQSEKLQFKDWQMRQLDAQLDIVSQQTDFSGTVDLATGKEMVFYHSKFSGKHAGGVTVVTSQTPEMKWGYWQFRDLKLNSTYHQGTLQAEIFCPSGRDLETTVHGLDGTFSVVDERVHAQIKMDHLILNDDLRISGLMAAGTINNHHHQWNGVIEEICYAPNQTFSPQVVWEASGKEGQIDFLIESQFLQSTRGNTTEAYNLLTAGNYINKIISGEFRTSLLHVIPTIQLNELSGTFSGDGTGLTFTSHADQAIIPIGELINPSMNGRWARQKLAMNLEAVAGEIWDYPCTDITATISYDESQLSVNRINANLYGGVINADYHDNSIQHVGKLWLNALEVDIARLTARSAASTNKPAEMTGKLSGKVDLKLSHAADNSLLLNGAGKVAIEEGNFWQIPILGDFLAFLGGTRFIGKIIPQSDLGVISKLNADLEFIDDRVNVPYLKTNGTLVTIAANGNYWWDTRQLDFRVTAEPLNSFFSKFVPEAIDPFDILLERRLKGTIDVPEWEEISAIRDFFRPQKKPKTKASGSPSKDL